MGIIFIILSNKNELPLLRLESKVHVYSLQFYACTNRKRCWAQYDFSFDHRFDYVGLWSSYERQYIRWDGQYLPVNESEWDESDRKIGKCADKHEKLVVARRITGWYQRFYNSYIKLSWKSKRVGDLFAIFNSHD